MSYGSGTYELATHTGTHLYLIIRLDSTLPMAEANRIQDGIVISANSDRAFTTEPVNEESFRATEQLIRSKTPAMLKAEGANANYGMFTAPTDESRSMYSQYKHMMGAALGWGGAQLKDNIYELSPQYPAEGCYQATFDDPRNGAFWSFTVYDEEGFMFDDLANMSSDTATPNSDGSYTVSLAAANPARTTCPSLTNRGSSTSSFGTTAPLSECAMKDTDWYPSSRRRVTEAAGTQGMGVAAALEQ